MNQTANYCLLLKVFDGEKTIIAISNYDSQLEINNTTYTSNTTLHLDKIENNTILDGYDTTVTLIPETTEQKEILLKNNKLKAEISCIKINKSKPQKTILKRGTIGDIAIEDTKISIEIKSITDILDNKINRRYTFSNI
jgi:hypothetical protein